METNITPMACGNCGEGLFKMFKQQLAQGFAVLAECTTCKSVTRIETRPAELTLEWSAGSCGRLCDMAPKVECAMTDQMLRDARKRVADSAYAALAIPGYTVLEQGPWAEDPEEAALGCALRLECRNAAVGDDVQARFVVRFADTTSAEMAEAYVVAGNNTILALVPRDDLRPNVGIEPHLPAQEER